MHSDSFFYKGKTHDVCEDYALSDTIDIALEADNAEEQIPIAIVCDGCSGSKDTDFGSRVIAKVAAENVRLLLNDTPELFGSSVITSARRIAEHAGWDIGCLDATLLIAASTEEYTDIFVAGDGVVALYNKDRYTIHDITYPSGAPRYLNYWHNPDRIEAYRKMYGDARVVYSHHFYKEEEIESPFETISDTPFWNTRINNSDFERVVLMSDGVHSFQQLVTDSGKRYDPVSMIDVVQNLTAFKGLKGEFVKRRVKRFAKSTEWENTDDVSVASISLV